MIDTTTPTRPRIAVVSAGLSDSSSTRRLAERLARATTKELAHFDIEPDVDMIDLRPLAGAISSALVTFTFSDELQQAIDSVAGAHALIAVTPTFKASYSGLFKSFFDLLDDEDLIDTPVLLGATGGTARHSLVIDTAMRPLFAYAKAATIPTAVFAATDDWGSIAGEEADGTPALSTRISAAGRALARVLANKPLETKKSGSTAKPAAESDSGMGPAVYEGGDGLRGTLYDNELEVTDFATLLARI